VSRKGMPPKGPTYPRVRWG